MREVSFGSIALTAAIAARRVDAGKSVKQENKSLRTLCSVRLVLA
ncbi:hypothetical protein MIZ01_0592 [Sideroxyarcus emersonii]|uniref:Uncharacterized protein n=1 Tax=Sideroxyarcus emersonii TaxID=2764705 RepID=A0AAN2BYA5_9PROT|nr:hypothetical protein MIZ01_0592 [Sideroxyarcus emersonii]